jgi:hypothetical protein
MNEEEKTYTMEDVRAAFVDGAGWAWSSSYRGYGACLESERRYPKPKKLREVPDANGEDVFYIWDGRLWGRNLLGHCRPVAMYAPTNERIKLWADLFANPYEDDK